MKVFQQFEPEVITLLQNGAIGVIPTDTVYGVVARLFDEVAVSRIYDVKAHSPTRAVGTILIGDPGQLDDLVPKELVMLAQSYWPGPTSVVLPVNDALHYAHRGLCSLPFRHSNSMALNDIVRQTGPLATSSANLSGQPVATTLQEAIDYFGNTVDFYVDGGDCSAKNASRIISIDKDGNEHVIREG